MKHLSTLFASLTLIGLLLCGCGEPPPPAKGKLEIRTEPAGAQIFSGGKELGVTPKEFRIAPGKYRFRVEKPGFHPVWTEVAVTAEKVQTAELKLEAQGSPVLICSDPTGAAVIFNGKKAGVTPLLIPAMLPGDYTAQLTAPHCAESTIRWSVKDTRPMEVSAKLISNIGTLILETDPAGCRLSVNGKEVGNAPYRAEVPVGSYRIRAEKDGFHPLELDLAVRSGAKTQQTLQLSAEPGILNIQSDPAGAQVRIDGKAMGATPLVLKDLAPGQHQLELLLPGYDPHVRELEIAPAASLEHRARLQRSTGGMILQVRPAGTKVLLNNREVAVTRARSDGNTQPIELQDLAPGVYKISAIHPDGEEESMSVRVEKGKITRPKALDVWVPNVRVKFKKNGMEETGMLYAETETTILYGPERGIRVEFPKTDFEYIKPLTDKATQTKGEKNE